MRLTVNNIKLPITSDERNLDSAISKLLRIKPSDIEDLLIKSKSIDARDKHQIKYIYSIEADIKGGDRLLNNKKFKNVSLPSNNHYVIPNASDYKGRPVIIGAGPAGLFCAYILILSGLKPIILERGYKVEDRKKDVEAFWESGVLNPNSNVQFGEGGAGTFSDGKLNTLVKDKNGRCSFVLQTFVKFGAPINILYDSKPHIGTDKLIDVIKNIREFICENGGEIHFGSLVNDIKFTNGKVTSVCVNNSYEIEADRVVLAIGHSSRDTFELLDKKNISMSPKPFAIGFRVEHPADFINIDRYGNENYKLLPAAPYKLTAQTGNGRGVYSFCMCPGGYVVNASSEDGMLAVNGMSYSGRNGANSNSAIIVTVNPEDFGSDCILSGMHFQRRLERKAYELGSGLVPVSTYGDFFKSVNRDKTINLNTDSLCLQYPSFEPNIKGGFKYAELHTLLPENLNSSFVEGMYKFGKTIKGYDSKDTFISGIESRTSSPVKIWRNENGQSDSAIGLYPCGEGAGYAGGITSAAMDGIYIAEQILKS